jgi:hypothetical protein
VHSSLWETVADALFWLQLGWVIAGFGLMAYLALKIFPPRGHADRVADDRLPKSGLGSGRSVILGGYRFESFPQIAHSNPRVVELSEVRIDGMEKRSRVI